MTDPEAEITQRLTDARPDPPMTLAAELRRRIVATAVSVPGRPPDLWARVALLAACGLALLAVALLLA